MNENLLLALFCYLDEETATQVEEMYEAGTEIENILNYVNSRLTPKRKAIILDTLVEVFPIIENHIDDAPRYLDKKEYPPSVRREMEYTDYLDKLDDEQAAYIKQFYHEWYNKGSSSIPEGDRILTTEEMLKEARRNNNALDRDAFNYTQNREKLHYLEDGIPLYSEYTETWEDIFNTLGYLSALERIVNDSMKEIDNSKLDKRVCLVRFYIKMERLRKLNNKDQQTRRERTRR